MRHYRNPGPKKKPRGKPFEKGNKMGGRKALSPDVKAAFESLLPDAIKALTSVVNNPKHNRREQAAEYIVNRVGGTPESTTKLQASGPNGEPLQAGPISVSVAFVTLPADQAGAQITRIDESGKAK